MKLECSIEKLKESLLLTEKVIGRNLTLPILESILFITKNKNLILRATNLSIGIETKIPAHIEKDGMVAIKGSVLSSLFSVLNNEGMVSIELINEKLKIKTKTNTIFLKSFPCDDFPTIPIIKGDEFSIPSKKFIEGLRSVYYSASISEIKPEIGSIYIYPDESKLVFVATDSFRLAEKKINIKQNLSFSGVLIPFKNINEIIKIFDGRDDNLIINLQKNQISITNSNIYLTSRVIDGVFPDYKQIIPKEIKTEVVVLKQDLLSSLKISNIFSDKFNQISIDIKPKEKIFKIKGKNIDVGENETNLSGALKGENVLVNFNYKYIVDCFQSISGDSISLELSGDNKAMIIKTVGDPTFMYLVMPMNK